MPGSRFSRGVMVIVAVVVIVGLVLSTIALPMMGGR
jgi:putative copper export protein